MPTRTMVVLTAARARPGPSSVLHGVTDHRGHRPGTVRGRRARAGQGGVRRWKSGIAAISRNARAEASVVFHLVSPTGVVGASK